MSLTDSGLHHGAYEPDILKYSLKNALRNFKWGVFCALCPFYALAIIETVTITENWPLTTPLRLTEMSRHSLLNSIDQMQASAAGSASRFSSLAHVCRSPDLWCSLWLAQASWALFLWAWRGRTCLTRYKIEASWIYLETCCLLCEQNLSK